MCLVSKRKYLEVVAQNKVLSDYSSEVSKENDELTNENDQLNVELEHLKGYIDDVEKACLLLTKELLHCWNLRSKHEEDRNGAFSGIEWGGVLSVIREGLEAYLAEENALGNLDKIRKMSDLLEQFNGEL
jgi:hypothetical protein